MSDPKSRLNAALEGRYRIERHNVLNPLSGIQLMVLDVDTRDGLLVGTPERVMAAAGAFVPIRSYDVFPDGSIAERIGGLTQIPGMRELHVVINFAEELRERLPE